LAPAKRKIPLSEKLAADFRLQLDKPSQSPAARCHAPPPVGRRRAPPPAAAAAVLSVPAAPARSKRRGAQSHAPAAQAASDGDSDPPALESCSDNDSSSSDFGVNPPKYTHALYFSPGFAAAFFCFRFCLGLSHASTSRLLPLVFSSCFLLASRGAQKKSQRSGNRQPRAEAAEAVAVTVAAACGPKPGAGI
jgi:hypothetical protein